MAETKENDKCRLLASVEVWEDSSFKLQSSRIYSWRAKTRIIRSRNACKFVESYESIAPLIPCSCSTCFAESFGQTPDISCAKSTSVLCCSFTRNPISLATVGWLLVSFFIYNKFIWLEFETNVRILHSRHSLWNSYAKPLRYC